jgi:1,4-alpha-glucan branching enzyme
MSISKQYLKSKPQVKVTFRLPPEAAPDAKGVSLVGDFNDWNIYASPMKKQKDGAFKVTLTLASDQEFQYRYLIDETSWENDWDADKYVRSAFGNCDNSVVTT